jgi:hypothetical protein
MGEEAFSRKRVAPSPNSVSSAVMVLYPLYQPGVSNPINIS